MAEGDISHRTVKYARKKLLVYPQFQMSLISINILITLVTFCVTLFQLIRSVQYFKKLGTMMSLAPDHPYFRLIGLQEAALYSNLAITFFIAMVLAGIITLFMSHRLAGPLVRMRGYLKQIAHDGRVKTKLAFRKGDYFSDLPEIVNEALSATSLAGSVQSDTESKNHS